jgi:hypothetical protein
MAPAGDSSEDEVIEGEAPEDAKRRIAKKKALKK